VASRRAVRLSRAANEDYTELIDHLCATVGLDVAARIDARIERILDTLGEMPERGRLVPELVELGYDEYRELITSPYRIVYEVGQDIVVVAIVDGRRQLGELLAERAGRITP
jgi:plasmid stabilization system protein ParE